MSRILYSDETLQKRATLKSYFDQIVEQLQIIEAVNIDEDWICSKATKFIEKLDEIQGKTPKMKSAVSSYETFLGIANTTYEDVSSDVDDAISTYMNS